MPFHRLYYHVTWATERRQPMIVPEIIKTLYSAIWDKAESLNAQVFAIGGVADHIHLAVSLPPTVALSDFVSGVKGASAYHVNHLPDGAHRIKWQRGYGVLSFSRDHLNRVVRYINGQERHHRESRLWASLENCGEELPKKTAMVRETRPKYDPFA